MNNVRMSRENCIALFVINIVLKCNNVLNVEQVQFESENETNANFKSTDEDQF
jgi:hypothetical protein